MNPSMAEAAKIKDVAARHTYVFEHGLTDRGYYDLAARMDSLEFELLCDYVSPTDDVLEVGCLTGLNLLGLAKRGLGGTLTGIDFVEPAISWLRNTAQEHGITVRAICGEFCDAKLVPCDSLICFDVIEHQLDMGRFLRRVHALLLPPDGRVVFLVPEGRHYHDCGHVAWFPDVECLRNVLEYFFHVDRLELLPTNKFFTVCSRGDSTGRD